MIGKVGEVWSLITPKVDVMLSALKESQDALENNDSTDLKTTENQAYLLRGFITVLENLQKGWDSHLDTLKNSYVDIFKFL